MGAAPNLAIPPVSVDGTRLTINSNLSPEQAAWNLRSAYNVAALNCMSAEHAAILPAYGEFLKTHERSLRSVNSTLDSKFKAEHGKGYIAEREMYQTQVYNYFALPPTIPAFCDATLALSREIKEIPPGQLVENAPGALARLENVFTRFFNEYDSYRRGFVDWQRAYIDRYGSPPADGYFLPGEMRYQPQPTTPALMVPEEQPVGPSDRRRLAGRIGIRRDCSAIGPVVRAPEYR